MKTLTSNLCKRRPERDTNQDTRENKNLNVGLLNWSNEKMGDGIDSSDIVIYVIAAICVMMSFKWMKKCWTICQERMVQQMQPVQTQMQPLYQPMQQIQQLPALAAPVVQSTHRNQFRTATISGPEDIKDSMQKCRFWTAWWKPTLWTAWWPPMLMIFDIWHNILQHLHSIDFSTYLWFNFC